MTVGQAIARIRALKPNPYPDEQLVGLLYGLDLSLCHELLGWHEAPPRPPAQGSGTVSGTPALSNEAGKSGALSGAPAPQSPPPQPPAQGSGGLPIPPYDIRQPDRPLLVPDPYSELYGHYLAAQIDYLNGETTRYNNAMVRYNTALSTYADHVNRTCAPLQRAGITL